MSILKNLSLFASFLAITACVSEYDAYDGDDYYMQDFSIQETQNTSEISSDAVVEEPPQEKKNITKKTPRKNEAKQPPQRKTLTEVSKKVADIDEKLRTIQKTIEKNAQTLLTLKIKAADEAKMYYEYVAQINARLRIGTTPGNPELSDMWEKALKLVSQADTNITQTAQLSVEDARLKNELESLLVVISGTFKVSGAMEFDHENLKLLEDEANQTLVTLRRLSSDTASQISRQEQFYATETRNIDALKSDVRYGKISGSNADVIETSFSLFKDAQQKILPQANIEGRKPLMVIRFSQKNIAYKQQLYEAVKIALEKRPSTNFEIIALVSNETFNQNVPQYAKDVYDALIEMGVPARRLSLTQSKSINALVPEVALYLK